MLRESTAATNQTKPTFILIACLLQQIVTCILQVTPPTLLSIHADEQSCFPASII